MHAQSSRTTVLIEPVPYLAVHRKHLESFKKYWRPGPAPRGSNLIKMGYLLGTGIFFKAPQMIVM